MLHHCTGTQIDKCWRDWRQLLGTCVGSRLVLKKLWTTTRRSHTRIIRTIMAVFIMLSIGAIWQYLMSWNEANQYAPPGQQITVNKHKMHIFAKGEGSPTVVLTVGSGSPCAYTDYYLIQSEISKVTRTVSYDRPGFGWSEPTSIPRTIDHQVSDLHELLNNAGEKPPYILVGHSLSSLEVIRYAQMYPQEVSGMVLIDGGNPVYYADYNELSTVVLNYLFSGLRKSGLVRVVGSLGIFLPILGEDQRIKLLPEELRAVDKMMFYHHVGNENNRDALWKINENAKEVINGGNLGDIPLFILTAEQDPEWRASQIELKNWSRNSRQEDIKGALHYIHWSNPEIVTDRIQELITQRRHNS